ARTLVPTILAAFDGIEIQDPDMKSALNYFRNWNFIMRGEDVTTSLFQAFLVKAIPNTFADELGPSIARLYDTLATKPLTALTELLQMDSSVWFDDVTTDHKETKNEIIRRSLEQGINMLRHELGGEFKEWRWGRIHQAEFGHVFGENPLLRPLFNVGPFAVGGAHSTVWTGDFRVRGAFKNHIGPSARVIVDLADQNNTRTVTPPGQSGHLFHDNYDDQIPLWLNGGYKRLPMDRDLIEQGEYDLLELRPKQ
ncbi:MAG: penicillin acylase family protein, partial [Ignavibacteriales bacterium]|nr:penicillin acylase family protein [Ignavibacteriales bacterium]